MIRDMILNALQSEGYDLISSMEYYQNFIKEVKTLKPGKYTYIVGKTEIIFKKI